MNRADVDQAVGDVDVVDRAFRGGNLGARAVDRFGCFGHRRAHVDGPVEEDARRIGRRGSVTELLRLRVNDCRGNLEGGWVADGLPMDRRVLFLRLWILRLGLGRERRWKTVRARRARETEQPRNGFGAAE